MTDEPRDLMPEGEYSGTLAGVDPGVSNHNRISYVKLKIKLDIPECTTCGRPAEDDHFIYYFLTLGRKFTLTLKHQMYDGVTAAVPGDLKTP